MEPSNEQGVEDKGPPHLSKAAYIILGMLSFRSMSGYELKDLIDRSIRHFYRAPVQSRIYTECRQLESYGLVSAERVVQEQRPNKRVYSLTAAGKEVIYEWLEYDKVEPDVYTSAFQLRLFLGHMISADRLMMMIADQQRWLSRTIMILEDTCDNLESRMQGDNPEEHLFFPFLAAELKLESLRAERNWTVRTIERLQKREWNREL